MITFQSCILVGLDSRLKRGSAKARMCQTKSSETVCYCGRKRAKKFLKVLAEEGAKSRCDESSEIFKKGMELPEFYEKEKFKRGQQFFHNNIFAMLYAKLLGLMADLSLITSQKILVFTNQSSQPKTAFRRYASTIFSMYYWYSYDLTPGSKSWESLKRIRNVHSFASMRAHSKKIDDISQYSMALAQFGFMGLVVSKYEKIGIHKPKLEDMEAFVHFWRVIGHVLGIEERFNICRDSFKETKEICDEIIQEVMAPAISQWQPTFLEMTRALIDGMWAMMPILQTKVWINRLYYLLNENNDNVISDLEVLRMTFLEKCLFKIIDFGIYLLRFDSLKIVLKHNMYLMLFLTQKFPFLAYYKYGLGYRHTRFVESAEVHYSWEK